MAELHSEIIQQPVEGNDQGLPSEALEGHEGNPAALQKGLEGSLQNAASPIEDHDENGDEERENDQAPPVAPIGALAVGPETPSEEASTAGGNGNNGTPPPRETGGGEGDESDDDHSESVESKTTEDRYEQIRDLPLTAFRQITSKRGITNANDLHEMDLFAANDLLLAAGALEAQTGLCVDEQTQPAVTMAGALLDRALELRQKGAPFKGFINSILSNHEIRTIAKTPSIDEFWDKAATLAEQRPVSPHYIKVLHECWRERFTAIRQQEQAEKVLSEYGLDPRSNHLPKGIHDLQVSIQNAAVPYEDIDTLLGDMRNYFVPRDDTPTITKPPAVSLEADKAIMRRVEREIKSWAQTGAKRPFRDSQDTGRHDPYKYTGDLFKGHGVGIGKTDEGFLFSLEGRDEGYNHDYPTRQIDNFAAYTGKEVTYGGSIRLTYTAEPPAKLAVSTISEARRVPHDAVETSLPIGEALHTLQELLNLTEEAKAELTGIIANSRSNFGEQGIRTGDLSISTALSNTPPRKATLSPDGAQLQGYSRLLESGGQKYFFLPKLGIEIKSDDPSEQAKLGRLFHALGTVAKSRLPKRYPHGYIDAYSSFKPIE